MLSQLQYYFDRLGYRLRLWRGNTFPGYYRIKGSGDTDFCFIISAGRSGSTMLRKRLMSRYHIHFPPESGDLIPRLFDVWMNTSRPEIPTAVAGMFESIEPLKLWELPPDMLRAELSEPEHLEDILCAIYNLHRKQYNSSATVLGDKTPYLAEYLPLLRVIFPRANYILLFRDSLPVVRSRMQRFQESIGKATDRWILSTREMLKMTKLDDFNSVTVHYEHLVQDAEQAMIDIEGHLTAKPRTNLLTVTDAMIGDHNLSHHSRTWDQMQSNRNDQLAGGFSEEERDYILKRTQKYRQALGYG